MSRHCTILDASRALADGYGIERDYRVNRVQFTDAIAIFLNAVH